MSAGPSSTGPSGLEAWGGGLPDEPLSPGGQPLAAAWMRVLARFLDLVILLGANYVIAAWIVLGGADGLSAGFDDASSGEIAVAGLIALVVGFGYEAACTALFGGSPMKLAFGMRVVRARDGSPVGWGAASMRWAVVAVWSIFPVLSLLMPLLLATIGLVFLFTRPMRQAVWDLAARTLVVRER